jgi:hypothetical protein
VSDQAPKRWISANDISARYYDPEEWSDAKLARKRAEWRRLPALTRFCTAASLGHEWGQRDIARVARISRRQVRKHLAAGCKVLFGD